MRLERLSGDDPLTIPKMLREHGGGERTLSELSVLYAELEVMLWTDGRRRSHVIRLWPDRSSLNHTALGERLQECLRRWGIAYAG